MSSFVNKYKIVYDGNDGMTYGSKGAYVESDWLGTYDVEVFGPNGSKVKIIIVKEDKQ